MESVHAPGRDVDIMILIGLQIGTDSQSRIYIVADVEVQA